MIARADEYPVRHFSNASRFKVIDATSVVDPGPPEVSRLTMSNILKFSIARKRMASIRNGIPLAAILVHQAADGDAVPDARHSFSCHRKLQDEHDIGRPHPGIDHDNGPGRQPYVADHLKRTRIQAGQESDRAIE